jgi:hypothetical protein
MPRSRSRLGPLLSIAAMVCGCNLFVSDSPVKPGGPPADSGVIKDITNDPAYSLAKLCHEAIQCDASSAKVVARGWTGRLKRLGLPCHRDVGSTILQSKTPDDIPFWISIGPHPNHPGSPKWQFEASLYWDKPADAEKGKSSLEALERTKPGHG